MRRAELKKAQTAEASPEQIAALEHALRDAEQALHDAEATSDQPAPDLVRVEKRPIDSQLRQLKTELAYARADLNKLERRADTPGRHPRQGPRPPANRRAPGARPCRPLRHRTSACSKR